MKYLITFYLSLLVLGVQAQSIKTSEINTPESVDLVESIVSVDIFKGKQFYIKIFKVANASGSANLAESHEISHDLILSISGYDENPETKLFRIGSFLNPTIKKKVDQGQSIMLLVDGMEHNSKAKRTYKIMLSEKGVRVE